MAKINFYALGNTGGRPPVYKDASELEKKIEEYFLHCLDNKVHIAITGLALYLGFSSRTSLFDYEQRPEFSNVIKRARMVVEMSYEHDLRTFKYGGSVFALKNMGWFDKQEIDHTTKGQAMNSPMAGLENLDPDELALMHTMLKKAKIKINDAPGDTSEPEQK